MAQSYFGMDKRKMIKISYPADFDLAGKTKLREKRTS